MTVAYTISSVTAKNNAGTASFTVKRSGTSSDLADASSVDYSTSDITATAGTDYVSTSGSLQFAANATEETISVTILSEAYSNSTSTTFLVSLTNYGSATGTIVPSDTGNTTQTYLYMPEDDDSVTVPTADTPGDNLKYQAVYSGFSDPDNSTVEMPLAYLRLGYARSDMNDYERVILDSDNYHPVWRGYEGDGTPIEYGPAINFALPRNIDRRDGNKDTEMENNAHLDGLFLYSNANYALSVGKEYSQVIKGDYFSSVEGEGRLLWWDRKADWVHDAGESSFITANGATYINGLKTDYEITAVRQFNVAASTQVNYTFDAKYDIQNDVAMEISNASKFEINNSMAVSVNGYQIAADCDVYGNFSGRFFTGEVASTRACFDQAATDSITLAIQTGVATGWTRAVQVAANLSAVTALGLSIGSAADTFKSSSEFYKMATPDVLDSTYSDAFGTDIPDTCIGLAAVTSAVVLAACIAQKIADAVPGVMPKIEMDATSLTLSCGPASQIELTAGGMYVTTPEFEVLSTSASIDVIGDMSVVGTALSVDTFDSSFTGNVRIDGTTLGIGDISSLGTIFGTLLDAGA